MQQKVTPPPSPQLDDDVVQACLAAFNQGLEQGAEAGRSAGFSHERICLLLATGIVQQAAAGVRDPAQLLRAGLDQLAETALRRLDTDLPRAPNGLDGNHYRGRAAALRALAEQMEEDVCKAPLLGAAENYDNYARTIATSA